MSFTPEAKVKKKVVTQLKAKDAYYFFPVMNGYGRAGIPDIVVCYRGQFIALECKAGSNKPTELQLKEIEAIRQAGGVSMVVNESNIEDVTKILESIDGTPLPEDTGI
jgi:hypothetical protein